MITPHIELIDLYDQVDRYAVTWQLLVEREDWVNITHRQMPTRQQHEAFVDSKPYLEWWVILVFPGLRPAGTINLSTQNEIGIFILRAFRRQGIGPEAVKRMINMHPHTRLLANINPHNIISIQMFEELGFKHIQNTYELRR